MQEHPQRTAACTQHPQLRQAYDNVRGSFDPQIKVLAVCLQTVEVSAKFVNGKPDRIEAFYIMKSAMQWDRFMRFMEHYAEDHGLNFNKVPRCADALRCAWI